MGEHDSLCSHALNNMTLNELAHTYADLKLENKRLRDALKKIAEFRRNGSMLDTTALLCILDLAKEALGNEAQNG